MRWIVIAGMGACTSAEPPKDAGPDSAELETAETAESVAETAGGSGSGETAPEESVPIDSVDSVDSAETGETAETGDTGRPASTRWVQVSLDFIPAAALTDNGSLACWGMDEIMLDSCPAGWFTQVAMGYIHACGLDEAGSVSCWGGGLGDFAIWDQGQMIPPSGTFSTLAAGTTQSCALDRTGALVCWGGSTSLQEAVPHGGPYSEVDLGFGWGCALTEVGEIECWADYTSGGLEGFGVGTPPEGPGWHGLSVGADHGCVLDAEGYVTCWGGAAGWYGSYEEAPTDIQFRSVSAGDMAACGITLDEAVYCWQGEDEAETWGNLDWYSPRAGTWSTVQVGAGAACALSTDGELACFGNVARRYGLMDEPALPE